MDKSNIWILMAVGAVAWFMGISYWALFVSTSSFFTTLLWWMTNICAEMMLGVFIGESL